MRTYWFIKLVLPTPLSPRIITYSQPNQYFELFRVKYSIPRTLRRTFFLEDMLGYSLSSRAILNDVISSVRNAMTAEPSLVKARCRLVNLSQSVAGVLFGDFVSSSWVLKTVRGGSRIGSRLGCCLKRQRQMTGGRRRVPMSQPRPSLEVMPTGANPLWV